MKRLLALGALLLLVPVIALAGDDRHDASAAAYEHLATALIEMRLTEDRLVEGILNHHFGLAVASLDAATADGAVGDHGKNAAEEITAIANEGGKRVQAVRQKLLKAGHHHHTDAETQEDYIWIDSKEKQGLLDLASRAARAADVAAVEGVRMELAKAFAAAMKPE